jgi:hypothetical protein
MPIKATVARQFTYMAIGKEPQVIKNVVARMEFPTAYELDDEIMTQVEKFYIDAAEVEDYDHDGMQTVIKYELGAIIVITYEEV